MRLLIVEDEIEQREAMRRVLEDHFGKDTVVGVGARTEAMKHDFACFDLILCDYNLPDANGMDVLDEIVARCSTPVLMVTGQNVGQIAAQAIRRGATDYVVKTGEYLSTIPLVVEKALTLGKIKLENHRLQCQLQSALETLRQKNEQLQQSLQRVEELAATDPLTGLYNRRHFSRLLEQMFAEAQRHEHDLSCVMIDLDSYKRLNDTYGHQVGDELLVLAGRVMQANLRQSDLAARYGGDEFVLLLPHAGHQEAAAVVSRISAEYAQASARLLKREEGVTMSMGIASVHYTHAAHADQLVAAADAALYRAKDAGRNRISLAVG